MTVKGTFIIRLQFVHTGVCELHGPIKAQLDLTKLEVPINQDLCRIELRIFQIIDTVAIYCLSGHL